MRKIVCPLHSLFLGRLLSTSSSPLLSLTVQHSLQGYDVATSREEMVQIGGRGGNHLPKVRTLQVGLSTRNDDEKAVGEGVLQELGRSTQGPFRSLD